ncbi:MAG: thioredoxin fold domain-containing protein [Bacteroidia bacterium]|nr:thioredoxin fold domain-containing protein [Bacteroidia bacterium]
MFTHCKILLLLCVLGPIAWGQQVSISYGNEALLLEEHITGSKPLSLLFFHYNGCPGCVEMEKTTMRDTAVIAFINNHFNAYSINTLSKNGKRIREYYKAGPQPVFIFIDANKEEVHRVCGIFPPAVFIEHMKTALSPGNTLKAQTELLPRKAADYRFLERYVRDLHVAYTLRDSLHVIKKAFEAFPESMYADSFFTRFFMDFAVYEQDRILDFHSKPYQFFMNDPGPLYKDFDSSRVAYVMCQIAHDALQKAEDNSDEKEYLAAMSVIKRFWRDNVYMVLDEEGDAVGAVFHYYAPLQAERSYQLFFRKDTAAYNRLEAEFFEKIKDDYEALYFCSAIMKVDGNTDERESLERRLKYATQGAALQQSSQMYAFKSAYEYLLGDIEAARQSFGHIRKKAMKHTSMEKVVYEQLLPKLGKGKQKQSG